MGGTAAGAPVTRLIRAVSFPLPVPRPRSAGVEVGSRALAEPADFQSMAHAVRTIGALDALGVAEAAWLVTILAPVSPRCLPHESWLTPRRWRHMLRHLGALGAPGMLECTRLMPALALPTAIVASDDYRAVPRVALDRVRAAIPAATLDIIRDVRHFSPEESPERVADVVARLLRS